MNIVKRTIRRFSFWLMELTDRWEPVERVMTEELEQELMLHPGKWTAITRDRLVAVGDTPKDVLDAAAADGVASPILYWVPLPGTVFVLSTMTS